MLACFFIFHFCFLDAQVLKYHKKYISCFLLQTEDAYTVWQHNTEIPELALIYPGRIDTCN